MRLRALLGTLLLAGAFLPHSPRVLAAEPTIILSEIAWAGSADSANDEWIELHNPGATAVDLAGWSITDDGAAGYALSGTIPARGFFLVERSEPVTSVASNLVVSGLSLANTGDALVLLDASGQPVDSANPGGGMWPAGSSAGYATMERIDPAVPGSDAAAWATSTAVGPATASAGSAVHGTPGAVNSAAAPSGTRVFLDVPPGTAGAGATVDVPVRITDGTDVLGFGMDVAYDPAHIADITADEGTFLASGATPTAFHAGLVDGVPGALRIAGSRITTPATVTSGSGTLAVLHVTLGANPPASVPLSIGASAFLAGMEVDQAGSFEGGSIAAAPAVEPVSTLSVVPGSARYTLALTWTAPAGGADAYRIERKDAVGSFVLLGETADPSFLDSDALPAGGALIPTRGYTYRVTAVRGTASASGVEALGSDPRGLLGDSTRDDTTDGRDLLLLARSWGSVAGSAAYRPLADTTVDGSVDDGDLVDLAQHWAMHYTP